MKNKIVSLFIMFILMFLLIACGTVENSISIICDDLMEIGDTKIVKVQYSNKNISKDLVYASDDEEVISISKYGTIKGLSSGVATITVYVKDDPTIYATKTIEVSSLTGPFKTRILAINKETGYIECENLPSNEFIEKVKIQKYCSDNTYKDCSIKDLHIGSENLYFYLLGSKIAKVVIDGDDVYSKIRVGIRNNINDISKIETLYHNSIELSCASSITLKEYDNEDVIDIDEDSDIEINKNNEVISVSVDGENILQTTKRIIFTPEDGEIAVKSISRGVGTPSYSGRLEVSLNEGNLILVNEVDLESYLYKVLPSEMPSNFGLEALKAQAVAARTYAYRDIYSETNCALGYTVDDSTSSQVYNNGSMNNLSTQAVNETKGIIMTYNGEAINAQYYSSSCGLTGTGSEVWLTTPTTFADVPYQVGHNYATIDGETVKFNYKSEDSMLEFYKMITMYTPDDGSQYHRWKVSMTYSQLQNTLEENLGRMQVQYPELILTKSGDNFISKTIPDNIGTVNNIFVSNRGTSGVVVSLDIETSSGTYRIYDQYNIRFVIRPMNCGSTVTTYYAYNTDTTYTKTTKNASILNSGFFAIEIDGDTVTFYGGGNGHGCGMSQYGAKGFAKAGLKYDIILAKYYTDIEFTQLSYQYDKKYRDVK